MVSWLLNFFKDEVLCKVNSVCSHECVFDDECVVDKGNGLYDGCSMESFFGGVGVGYINPSDGISAGKLLYIVNVFVSDECVSECLKFVVW